VRPEYENKPNFCPHHYPDNAKFKGLFSIKAGKISWVGICSFIPDLRGVFLMSFLLWRNIITVNLAVEKLSLEYALPPSMGAATFGSDGPFYNAVPLECADDTEAMEQAKQLV
jgi:hypothetical protein